MKSRLQIARAMLLTPLLFATLTACAHPIQTAATSQAAPPSACLEFKLIIYSRLHDTPETIIQVKDHNARYAALCPAVH